jgi:serine/threonine protein kinase
VERLTGSPPAVTVTATSRLGPGEEPVPGYRLLAPLGSGGFGEVWKCEAPGGLHKAVKFVKGGDEARGPAAQELAALQRVKTIRHPFILSLDRVEVVGPTLLIVMELADRSLRDVHADYQALGQPGVPRDELLAYLLEAAEALDWMNFEHGLQHLDIKPHNLFVVSNHLKVADFGLVDRLREGDAGTISWRPGAMTPLYAPPELLGGGPSRQSDQYSLAIVYQQLLTGKLPFAAASPHQVMKMHLTAAPDLTPLPEEDRPAVARALAKAPEQRYPSCMDFVQALLCGESAQTLTPSGIRRLSGSYRVVAVPPEEKRTKSLRRPGASAAGDAPRPDDVTPPASTEPPEKTVVSPDEEGQRGDASSSHPTGVVIPGYRFVRCVSQSPLGDLWAVQAEDGTECRALSLARRLGADHQLLARLQTLDHPALPPAEVFRNPEGRVVLITRSLGRSLRERFEECVADGKPGVPREELLGYLRAAAAALDQLLRREGLRHLGLSPRSLLLTDAGPQLSDFGVIDLAWLPAGQSAAQLNPRYCAPELFDGPAGETADQYSLALIYAELLSGFDPHRQRSASGVRRRAPLGAGRSGARPRPCIELDLDLLPASDRPILARALGTEPARRFPTCLALVQALEDAGRPAVEAAPLPLLPVIPYPALRGEPTPEGLVLPSAADLAGLLACPSGPGRTAVGPRGLRYTVRPDGAWEHRCPVQVVPGVLRLRAEGFRLQWKARAVREADDAFVYTVEVPRGQRGFWDCFGGRADQLEVRLELPAPSAAGARRSEAVLRLRPVNARARAALDKVGVELLDSLRSYLQAGPDQRAQERWPCPQPLRIYPVGRRGVERAALEAAGRDVSLGGASFRLARRPAFHLAYLHWHQSADVADFALLARVARVKEDGDGYEVGVAFGEGSA